MSRYSPTNPAVDACLNLESKATKGLVSRKVPTPSEAKDDAMSRVVEYVKLIRDVRKQNKQDG